MKRFEYCSCAFSDADLNELGKQGWEAVGIADERTYQHGIEVHCNFVLLKRELPEYVGPE